MDGGGEKERNAPLIVRLRDILASTDGTGHRTIGPSALHTSGQPIRSGGLDRGGGVSSSCPRLRNSFARALPAQPRTPKVGKDGANALEGAQAKVADPHRG